MLKKTIKEGLGPDISFKSNSRQFLRPTCKVARALIQAIAREVYWEIKSLKHVHFNWKCVVDQAKIGN